MQRVSKILVPVAENVNLAPDTITPALLASATEGDYVVVNRDTGEAITGATPDTTITNIEIYVLCGGNLVSSGPIKKGKVSSYNRSEFSAAIPRILTTATVPAPTAAGTEYVLYVSNQEADNYFLPRKRFAVTSTAAMTTASLLGDALAEAMTTSLTVTTPGSVAGTNAELSISVANNAGVLTVTGIDSNSATGMISSNTKFAYEVLFEIAMGNNLENVAITRTQEPDSGCGEGSELRKMEEIHKGYLGHLNNVTFSSVAYGTGYTYKTALASNYDMVAIEYDSPHYSIQEGNVPFQETLVLAAITTVDLAGFPAPTGDLAVILETVLDMDGSWS